MRVIAVGEAAAQLDWLWPDAVSLRELARPLSLASWHRVRHDPSALLLLAATELPQPIFRFHHHRCIGAIRRTLSALESAPPAKLDCPDAVEFIDWSNGPFDQLLRDATHLAGYAEVVAQYTRTCDPSTAWIAGMLAPLGWFAVASRDPRAVAECVDDPDYHRFALEAEREVWGLNHAEIARRIGRRMRLPAWLQTIVGYLDLSTEAMVSLGGSPELVATVRIAIELAEQNGLQLRLLNRSRLAEDLKQLRLDARDLPALEARYREAEGSHFPPKVWQDPRSVPLMGDLLQASLGDRFLSGPDAEAVEREVDQLHHLIHQQERLETNRLEDSRIASLAEFAAGAAHEINNPLAVISGQSQYLFKTETDESRRESLQSIVRQVNRIHTILKEVMQFARPGRPNLRIAPIEEDIQATLAQLSPLAQTKKISLELQDVEVGLTVQTDPKQMQIVLGALIRNAIEASPEGGWVRLSVHRTSDLVEIAVEDSGPGLYETQIRHAFDPFYSGRSAGRGRGFGLPTAWRLAREQGGEVRHETRPGKPTRFVVRLPLVSEVPRSLRQSA